MLLQISASHAPTMLLSSPRILSISRFSSSTSSLSSLPNSIAAHGSTNTVAPVLEMSWTMPLISLRNSTLIGITYRPSRSVIRGSWIIVRPLVPFIIPSSRFSNSSRACLSLCLTAASLGDTESSTSPVGEIEFPISFTNCRNSTRPLARSHRDGISWEFLFSLIFKRETESKVS